MVRAGTPSAKYPMLVKPEMKKKGHELQLAAQFGNPEAKAKLAAYMRRKRERMHEAGSKKWDIGDKLVSRYEVMDVIVTRVANGDSWPKICLETGYPSLQQVYEWKRCHPAFAKALKEADEVRGHILGEQALQIALDTDRENVAADKLKVEVLSKFAARANASFQDKTVAVEMDEYSQMSNEQIKARIKALVAANPSLLESSQDALGTALPSLSVAPEEADLVQSDSLDVDAG